MTIIKKVKAIFQGYQPYRLDAVEILETGCLPKLKHSKKIVEIEQAELMVSQLNYWVGENPIIHLPVEMLVMPGGHAFANPAHPFLKTIKEGHQWLFNHYSEWMPQNIAQLYGIEESGELGENLEPWEIPWLLRERKKPRGEVGLSSSHGLSYYGPISQQKAIAEYNRLNKVVNSISKHGYKIQKGVIEGFFMRKGDEFRFFVLGGKHRVAAMAYLGYKSIPVRMRASYPRLVDRVDAVNWPLVHSKHVSLSLALRIFDAYFRS